MSDAEMLQKVKEALGITGDYQDNTLLFYIEEVKEYLTSAGVSESIIQSKKSVGCICRGVTDLWCYGAGQGKLSEYFMQRAIQLTLENSEVEDDEN